MELWKKALLDFSEAFISIRISLGPLFTFSYLDPPLSISSKLKSEEEKFSHDLWVKKKSRALQKRKSVLFYLKFLSAMRSQCVDNLKHLIFKTNRKKLNKQVAHKFPNNSLFSFGTHKNCSFSMTLKCNLCCLVSFDFFFV